jgi:hypothetical protein
VKIESGPVSKFSQQVVLITKTLGGSADDRKQKSMAESAEGENSENVEGSTNKKKVK